MVEHFIEKNYKNLNALPEFESGLVEARVTSMRFQRGLSHEECGRSHSSSIHCLAQVVTPEILGGRLIEIELMRFEDPSVIRLKGEDKTGVGLLVGYGDLAIYTVFEPTEYEKAFQMLYSAYRESDLPISVSARVLGLNTGCEWKSEEGPLMVEKIDFLVGGHET